VVGEESESVDVTVSLEAVELHACVVIDVHTSLLSHSKQHLIVQEPSRERDDHRL
jgi:hypothetical protein